MGIQNNWGDQIVAEDFQIQLSSSYIDNIKSSISDYNKFIPNSVGSNIPIVEQNVKINRKREIKEEKNQEILSEKDNLYYPTN
jgi:hypothetical protein